MESKAASQQAGRIVCQPACFSRRLRVCLAGSSVRRLTELRWVNLERPMQRIGKTPDKSFSFAPASESVMLELGLAAKNDAVFGRLAWGKRPEMRGAMTDQEWMDAELIIARCATVDDLSSQIARHAKIVLYLVCELCQKNGQTELGIRWLYRIWAEMAVKEFRSPKGPGTAN